MDIKLQQIASHMPERRMGRCKDVLLRIMSASFASQRWRSLLLVTCGSDSCPSHSGGSMDPNTADSRSAEN